MFVPSNMTDEECLRLHGALPRDRTEALIDALGAAPNAEDIRALASEAMSQFPAEDFLAAVITQLHQLRDSSRGTNVERITHVIEQLDDIAQRTFAATDYGCDVLHQIIDAC